MKQVLKRLGAVLACVVAGPGVFPADAEPGSDVPVMIGEVQHYTTRHEDTLLGIARRFDLGFVELVAANPGVDPWLPGEGVRLTLPTGHLIPHAPRRGIVINLADQRLYFFPPQGADPLTFPVGTGRCGFETPTAVTRVEEKQKDPTWFPPASILAERPDLPAAVPPGPDNPLGAYAIYLELSDYVIHGTNQPLGIGRRVSHGCIRLYPEDIATLFPLIAVGTSVTIIDQAVKTGWVQGELYLEVHPTQAQADEVEATGRVMPGPVRGLTTRIADAAGKQINRVDWSAVYEAARHRRGVPVVVTVPPPPPSGARETGIRP